MKKLFVMICALLALSAHAEWTGEEKSWLVADEILLLTDYKTTKSILYNNPDHHFETNIILGRHPTEGKLNIYMGTVMIGSYFLADYLDHDNRLLFLKVATGVELFATGHNLYIGGKISF